MTLEASDPKDPPTPRTKDTPEKSLVRKIAVISFKIGRMLFYLGSVLTFILFWWSFFGIIIGLIFYRLSKSPTWRFHWLVTHPADDLLSAN